jgi:3-oxoacyl-[acyl-carrier protein] reductase
MDLGLTDKVAIVTGSSRGLGLASARALALEGCRVTVCARTGAALQAAAGDLAAVAGGSERVLAVTADVSQAEGVQAVIDGTVARFGGIDVLVHGAAECSPRTEFEPAPPWDFSASVRALFNVTRGVLEAMRKQCSGRIHHLVPAPDKARGPALFSIAGFCQSVAADVAPFGIEVTAGPAHAVDALLCPASGRGQGELLEEA